MYKHRLNYMHRQEHGTDVDADIGVEDMMFALDLLDDHYTR